MSVDGGEDQVSSPAVLRHVETGQEKAAPDAGEEQPLSYEEDQGVKSPRSRGKNLSEGTGSDPLVKRCSSKMGSATWKLLVPSTGVRQVVGEKAWRGLKREQDRSCRQ